MLLKKPHAKNLHSFGVCITLAGVLSITSCHVIKPYTLPPTSPLPLNCATTGLVVSDVNCLSTFSIQGKLAIKGRSSTPAVFYTWQYQPQNMQLTLQGAMGIGLTTILFDGQQYTLENSKLQLSNKNPNELAYEALGLELPVHILPFWINGKAAKTLDIVSTDPLGRISEALHDAWHATFTYASPIATTPKLLIMNATLELPQPETVKVTMSILPFNTP